MRLLSRAEELVMLSIWQLKENAYLIPIREYISSITGKDWSIGAVYVPLDRLTKVRYIETYLGESTPERGGRRKKFYKLTEEGYEALVEALNMHDKLWQGFPGLEFKSGKTS